MPFPRRIELALKAYQKKKYWFSKDLSTIKDLKNLTGNEQSNLFKIYSIFIGREPEYGAKDSGVYDAIKDEYAPKRFQVNFNVLKLLNRAAILSEANFNIARNCYNKREIFLDTAVEDLLEAHMLTDENFVLCATHRQKSSIAEGLIKLNRAGILDNANREAIKNHTAPNFIAFLLCTLKGLGLLNDETRAIAISHPFPNHLAYLLILLNNFGLASFKNFEAMSLYKHGVCTLEETLNRLIKSNILTQMTFDVILNGSAYLNAYPLCILAQKNLVTEENCKLIQTHEFYEDTAELFCLFHDAQLLTEANKKFALEYPAYRCVRTLKSLFEEGVLNQVNLDIIISRKKYASLDDDIRPEAAAQALLILYRAKILTQENRDFIKNNQYFMNRVKCFCILQSVGLYTSLNRARVIGADCRAIYILHDAKCLDQNNLNTILEAPDSRQAALAVVQRMRSFEGGEVLRISTFFQDRVENPSRTSQEDPEKSTGVVNKK